MSDLEVSVSAAPIERQPRPRRLLLRTREVAKIFDVEPETVTEWVRTGKLRGIRTPGGQQYRVRTRDVEALLEHGIDAEAANQ